MSYCLNPNCPKPENQEGMNYCTTCGTKLYLFDRYYSLKLIGQGGFGRTILAEDKSQHQNPRCIIKQFYSQSHPNTLNKAQDLFQQEARSLQELGEHPQIPNFYNYLQDNNYQYIVQEYIDGENLAQEIKLQGVFQESEIYTFLESLLPVLQFIHEKGVIHRDIKPENIIRRRIDNQFILVDFGSVKQASLNNLGKTGTSIGTPEYIAPEQAKGKAIFASDIYSLGITCLYLLTGVSPFDLFDIHQDEWIWRNYLMNNPVGIHLGKILDKMVQNSLKNRYYTVTDVLQDIRNKNSIQSRIIRTLPSLLNNSLEINSNLQKIFKHHKGSIYGLRFTPDNQYLISGSWDNSVKILELNTEKIIQNFTLKDSYSIYGLDIDPEGQLIAICHGNNNINLWNMYQQREIRKFRGHKGLTTGVNDVKFSPDGNLLASAGGDKTIRIWEVETGKTLHILQGHERWVSSIYFSPDSLFLVSGSADKTAKLWNVSYGVEMRTFRGHTGLFAGVNDVLITPDGETIITASDDTVIKFWHLKTGAEITSLEEHTHFICKLAISADGQYLASGSYEGTIVLWSIPETKKLGSLIHHKSAIRSLTFSSDNQYLASGGEDNLICLWQLNNS